TCIGALVARSLVPSVVVHFPWPGSSTKIIAPGMDNCFIFASSSGRSFFANVGSPVEGIEAASAGKLTEQARTIRSNRARRQEGIRSIFTVLFTDMGISPFRHRRASQESLSRVD